MSNICLIETALIRYCSFLYRELCSVDRLLFNGKSFLQFVNEIVHYDNMIYSIKCNLLLVVCDVSRPLYIEK